MRINAVIEGLTIISKHLEEDWFDFYAQHEQCFLCGELSTSLTGEELERLDELGFFQTDDGEWSFLT